MEINLALRGWFRCKKLVPFSATGHFAVLYFLIASNILVAIGPARNKKDAVRSRVYDQIWIRGGFVQKNKVVMCKKKRLKTVTTNAERQPTLRTNDTAATRTDHHPLS